MSTFEMKINFTNGKVWYKPKLSKTIKTIGHSLDSWVYVNRMNRSFVRPRPVQSATLLNFTGINTIKNIKQTALIKRFSWTYTKSVFFSKNNR